MCKVKSTWHSSNTTKNLVACGMCIDYFIDFIFSLFKKFVLLFLGLFLASHTCQMVILFLFKKNLTIFSYVNFCFGFSTRNQVQMCREKFSWGNKHKQRFPRSYIIYACNLLILFFPRCLFGGFWTIYMQLFVVSLELQNKRFHGRLKSIISC